MQVVNLRSGAKCTHYCGRIGYYNAHLHGVNMQLGNPFHVAGGTKGGRRAAINAFERWARARPDVLARIRQIPEDAVLGCWCTPLECHIEAIVRIWREMQP